LRFRVGRYGRLRRAVESPSYNCLADDLGFRMTVWVADSNLDEPTG
jgi:hypothetical protein